MTATFSLLVHSPTLSAPLGLGGLILERLPRTEECESSDPRPRTACLPAVIKSINMHLLYVTYRRRTIFWLVSIVHAPIERRPGGPWERKHCGRHVWSNGYRSLQFAGGMADEDDEARRERRRLRKEEKRRRREEEEQAAAEAAEIEAKAARKAEKKRRKAEEAAAAAAAADAAEAEPERKKHKDTKPSKNDKPVPTPAKEEKTKKEVKQSAEAKPATAPPAAAADKRKGLWGDKKQVVEASSRMEETWQSAAFEDDQTKNKFMRLMGLGGKAGAQQPAKPALHQAKRQQEHLLGNLEGQFETARKRQHFQQGKGLGF